ncbi:MAG: Ig-like domain repeat protein [Planctomycetes bacterium]|nr:Ig-like domain repeat protein [Planctomycetota bacterium]
MRWAKISLLLAIAALPSGARSQQTAAPPAAASVHITQQRAFSFPVSLPAAAALGGEPAVIELWFSTDRGVNWRRYDMRRPDAGPFVVQTDHDGEYWFASRILDSLNRVLYQPPQLPERRVIVDTVAPRMEFTAAAGFSGEVQGQWRVHDEHLKPDSLSLEYQPAPNQPWQPLPLERPPAGSMQTSLEGATRWFPQTNQSSVSFKATVLDQAGNSTVVTRTVTFSHASPPPASQDLAPVQPYSPARPQPGTGNVAAVPANPPTANPIPWPADNAASSPAPALTKDPYRRPDSLTTDQSAAPPLMTNDGQPGATRVSPVADDGGPRRISPSPAPPIGPQSLPGGERPRMTNSRKFQLEYDVASVGPHGADRVELWITRDGGRTWQAWSTDPDRESPMEVSLEHEGVYGFRVVVTGRNGYSGAIPTPGEMADVWIGVDLTAPEARLTGARYGAGRQAGQLDIRWDADDVMLAARPVTLLFSESPDGPWTIVATGLPNSGAYNWAVDPRTPRRIYLRLEVRDEAGNVGTYQLREPINLEGLQPKARVRGIQPIGQVEFGAMRPSLFR